MLADVLNGLWMASMEIRQTVSISILTSRQPHMFEDESHIENCSVPVQKTRHQITSEKPAGNSGLNTINSKHNQVIIVNNNHTITITIIS